MRVYDTLKVFLVSRWSLLLFISAFWVMIVLISVEQVSFFANQDLHLSECIGPARIWTEYLSLKLPPASYSMSCIVMLRRCTLSGCYKQVVFTPLADVYPGFIFSVSHSFSTTGVFIAEDYCFYLRITGIILRCKTSTNNPSIISSVQGVVLFSCFQYIEVLFLVPFPKLESAIHTVLSQCPPQSVAWNVDSKICQQTTCTPSWLESSQRSQSVAEGVRCQRRPAF